MQRAFKGKYDVAILGGGLAGITLALQLKQQSPNISILVLERRVNEAPAATHKVGESTSELASSYLRETLGLGKYLDENQLLKFGLRFYFSEQHSNNISRRVEVGTRNSNFYPTHQLDRGLLENDLIEKLRTFEGAEVLLGATVKEVDLSKDGNTICFVQQSVEYSASAKWVVDSSGRSGLLKRKLDLGKDIGHSVNAVWFRLGYEIDIQDWSDDTVWRSHILPGLRHLATNHLMGKGYWVWLIPLVSGSTSIGIVADPAFHPFEDFNTFEKAMKWLERHEPLAWQKLEEHKHKKMDFKVMKNFAYDSKQFFSSDRWAVTGEAGAFMDPFYSPGSDFIALSNTWITDLILRDLQGQEIALHVLVYELAQKELLKGWILIYRNMYGLFGQSRIMLLKIVWDWASYWAIPCVLFMNKGYTNMSVLRYFSSSTQMIGKRFSKLNEQMQALFQDWGKHDDNEYADFCGNLFDLRFFKNLQLELSQKYDPDELMQKIDNNLKLLEQVAAEIFRKVSHEVNDTPAHMPVNPFEMTLDEGKEALINRAKSNNSIGVDDQIKADIEVMWLAPVKTNASDFAQ